MRHDPHHYVADPEVVRQLIRENPWAILVSRHDGQLVASHYPVLLDEECDELAVFSHVGRPDEELHGFGSQEIMLIIQGAHGYISPSWYAPGETRAPTWNFAVAHCYGVPQILDGDSNLDALARLVQHFECEVENPMLLDLDWGARIAQGTVGIRLPIRRFQCKVKMSQDKRRETRQRVIQALREPGAYQHRRLAGEMQRELDQHRPAEATG